MKNLGKKIILFLVVALLLEMIPSSVMAADNPETILADEYVNLAKQKSYTVDVEAKVPGAAVNSVRINSNEVSEDARILKEAGDYAVELVCDDMTYKYNVICYRRGDANVDGSRDVRDLIAAYRIDKHTKKSENYGANMNGYGEVNSDDYFEIRSLLIDEIKPVVLLDFEGYTGEDKDLSAYFTANVEKGKSYTFSFNYYRNGASGNTSVINSIQVWDGKSDVGFADNQLHEGKGTYTFTFTADYPLVRPVFQTHAPYGTPKLYVWDISLVEAESGTELLSEPKLSDFGGNLVNAGSASISDMDGIQHSSYDSEAEARRQEILDMPDTVQPSTTGTTYYVSYNGSDNNDGLTLETAWRSPGRVTESVESMAAGDVVLFERGGVYRGTMILASGVTYGAYGTGSKPCIYGSMRNYAEEGLWESTEDENVWRINVGTLADIGNIVFNHGEECGIKKLEYQLQEDFDYYHDIENGKLYLYLSYGNPGKVYSDIEICSNTHIMYGTANTQNVTIENLCLKYTGAHGIVFSTGSKNITVQGCEIGYVGGSMLSGQNVRYGNGFEVVDNCDTIVAKDNWVYQCYDAGITHQSSNTDGCQQKNITVSGNLIEFCTYNIEYYVNPENGKIIDTTYQNNILRFAGYGFGSVNRIGSDNSMDSNICCYVRGLPSSNFVIQNNVLDSPSRFQTTIGYPNDTASGLGPVIKGNTYILQGREVAKILNEDGSVEILYADSLEELTECIKFIDKEPASVAYEN